MAGGYIRKCPECGSLNLMHNSDKGEVICRDCGLVLEDKMVDFGQEWREFDHEQSEKRRRTGALGNKNQLYSDLFFGYHRSIIPGEVSKYGRKARGS